MASPFPGMDPYLEHPEVWPGVHLLLIAALSEALAPQLRPKYSVSIEVRMYETTGEQSLLVGIPDVVVQKSARSNEQSSGNVALAEAQPSSMALPIPVRVPMPVSVRQGFLEVREVATKEVVTALELLSPVNKRMGSGRQTYETKRQRVLNSSTHLIELDLLRAYEPMLMYGDGQLTSDYKILVSRSNLRPQAELYAWNLRDTIPSFKLPLRDGDLEPTVNLQQLLTAIYERSGYDLKLDYQQAPVPPLANQDADWANSRLESAGLR